MQNYSLLVQGRYFVNPKFSARNCECGDVLGISLERAVMELNLDIRGEAIRSYITAHAIGHNGLKINFADGQRSGSHIRRNAFPKILIEAIDNGEYENNNE